MEPENSTPNPNSFFSLLNPRTIRFKLLATIVFSFLSFSTFVSYNQTREVFVGTKKDLLTSAQAFAELSVNSFGDLYLNFYNSGFLTFASQSSELLNLNKDISKVEIINPDGEILYDSNTVTAGDNLPPQLGELKTTDPRILEGLTNAKELQLENSQGDVDRILVPFTDPFGFQPFSILYTLDYERANTLSRNTFISIVLTAIFSTLAVIFLTLLVLHYILLSPISKVIFGARKVTAGQLDYQISLKGNDEITDLAEAVNFMAAALRKDIEDLKSLDKLKDEFIMIASHNLRTPLTAIKGYLSFLKADIGKKVTAEDQDYINRTIQASEKLGGLVEELVKIVNIKSNQEPIEKKPVDVKDLLNSAISNLETRFKEKGITPLLSVGTVPQVSVDRTSIESVLNNIIDNAIKFSKENSKVEISSFFDQGKVVISVRDYGVGMTEDQVNNLFQKFHRNVDILTYDYEGEGIGLYLNQLILEAHGGQIWVNSKPNEGSTFSFNLPIASS